MPILFVLQAWTTEAYFSPLDLLSLVILSFFTFWFRRQVIHAIPITDSLQLDSMILTSCRNWRARYRRQGRRKIRWKHARNLPSLSLQPFFYYYLISPFRVFQVASNSLIVLLSANHFVVALGLLRKWMRCWGMSILVVLFQLSRRWKKRVSWMSKLCFVYVPPFFCPLKDINIVNVGYTCYEVNKWVWVWLFLGIIS